MAASHQVVITLTAVNSPDEFRKRVITLTPALTNIQIGRSSKSQIKNLTAAQDNAWFDSPVMSREHAELWYSPLESRSVYLKDIGSMHGTFVQDCRLLDKASHRLEDGDTVTFGIQVTRAQETFPAKAFRVKYEWQEWIPPTPKSTSPAQSSHNVNSYAVLDGSPDAELSHEPSILFHCPSSRESSMPNSDSSDAGGVAEEDLIGDDSEDELEVLRQAAEGSPSPVTPRSPAPAVLSTEGKDTDPDTYSNMARKGQVGPQFAARDGVGDSEHNPIQLDTDIHVQGVAVDEGDDVEPEVASNAKLFDVDPPTHPNKSLPYGYVLETPAARGSADDSTADVGQDSDEPEAADISDDDDLESTNREGVEGAIDVHEEKSSPIHPGRDRVYQSTYVDLDEEDEDASSSIEQTEDEGIEQSLQGSSEATKEDDQKRSANHLDTLRSKPSLAVLVDHTQHQTPDVPVKNTTPVRDVAYCYPLHDTVVLGHPTVSERAPSPSDAAMAKTNSGKDSQLIYTLNHRQRCDQDVATVLQNFYNDRPPFTGHETVTSTENFFQANIRNRPSINHGISREFRTNWQAPKQHPTNYSDGPFKGDAERTSPSFAHVGSAPNIFARDTAPDSQMSRSKASHLFYRENRPARIYDGPIDELPFLPGHRDLAVGPSSHTSAHRLQSARSYTAPTSTCGVPNQSDYLPDATRAATILSIGDIVESRSAQGSTPASRLKRKASEMSADQDELLGSPIMSQSSDAVSNTEDFPFPDAQPREVSEFATQFRSTQSTEASPGMSRSTGQTATRDGRPKKRVKTIAKWIGTTILLGVGAMVTLGVTAPQSVWDEIDREMGLA